MRNFTRITVTTVAVAGLALVGTLPAIAADDTTSATVEVTGGTLSMSAPDSVALTATTPGESSTGTLTDISVIDTRAGVEGWVTSIVSTDFESAGKIIPMANVSYVPGVAEIVGAVTVAESTATAGTGAVQTATAVTGNNTATWDATLNVLVPANALAAADYTAVLTHSVI